MGFQQPGQDLPGNLSPLDVMLAEIALRMQLSPTDHGKAVDRYETVSDWIDRPDSPLCGLFELTYAQGSMAIGATIARCSDRDEYDRRDGAARPASGYRPRGRAVAAGIEHPGRARLALLQHDPAPDPLRDDRIRGWDAPRGKDLTRNKRIGLGRTTQGKNHDIVMVL